MLLNDILQLVVLLDNYTTYLIHSKYNWTTEVGIFSNQNCDMQRPNMQINKPTNTPISYLQYIGQYAPVILKYFYRQ